MCRAYGARCSNDFFPALTGWANFCRAYGAEREVKRASETRALRRATAKLRRRIGGCCAGAAPTALKEGEVERAGETPALRRATAESCDDVI